MRAVASAGLWLGWAVGTVASFVPLPLALTALRTVAPAAVAATLAAAVAGHPSAVAVAWSAVACAWAYAPAVGMACVNGPAYPNERRFLLRPPLGLLAGPLPLAWAASVAGLAAGPLLLAARQWVLGGAVLAVGWPAAALLLKSVHNLSRRWAVFVPAGLVLHDPMVLVDPVLFRRQDVTRLGLATGVDAGRLDASQRAPGVGLAVDLDPPVVLTFLRPGRREGDAVEAALIRFTPTRPGAVLDEARRRRMATSAAAPPPA